MPKYVLMDVKQHQQYINQTMCELFRVFQICIKCPFIIHRISGVMVSVLASSAVNRGFESRSIQTKDYTTDMCCFSAKHAAFRRKSKEWLARNQDNVSDMSIHGRLFQ